MNKKAVIIGSGIGGLACAIRLQLLGIKTSIFEANSMPGGKIGSVSQQGFRFDTGPSLFTLPELVEDLFYLAGKEMNNYLNISKLEIITRYFYEDGLRVTASADKALFAEQVAKLTNENKSNIENFLRHCKEIYDTTTWLFLEKSLNKLSTYTSLKTLKSLLRLHRIKFWRTMHDQNCRFFKDERIIQLFDRYATYNGSNPYEAPATLNLIAHIEHEKGAYFPEKGMYQFLKSVYTLAKDVGVTFHFNQKVDQILIKNGEAIGIRTGKEKVEADFVISNADIFKTYEMMEGIKPPKSLSKSKLSSSALIFYWGIKGNHPELDLHNIFFSKDYKEEFRHIFKIGKVFSDPTIYDYVSSKKNPSDAPTNCENWFVMINVPSDTELNWDTMIPEIKNSILNKLERILGKTIKGKIITEMVRSPVDLEKITSSTSGAIYGNNSNTMFSAFLRHPNFSSRIKNLYFCGGSVHPGGGIPLCLNSAKIVANLINERLSK